MRIKPLSLSAISSGLLLALSGCGGSDDPYGLEERNYAPTAQDLSIDSAKQWQPYQATLAASDQDGDSLSFSFYEDGIAIAPENGTYQFSHGLLSLSGKSLTYTSISGEDAVIGYKVSAGGDTVSAEINITNVQSDPLAKHQWHLRNTGQSAFALSDTMKQGLINFYVNTLGYEQDEAEELINLDFAESKEEMLVAGEDMNLMGALAHGVTGAGVTAVVVDSGLEIAHEDLQPNVVPNRSLNLELGAGDKTDPTSTSVSGDHGTSVAGLIAAKGWNGLGGRGVAPDTGLIGMNYLSGGDTVPQTEFLIHGFPGSGISEGEAISAFNRSYGITYPTAISYSPLDEAIESYPNKYLRSGKGALNIKSSGNGFNRGTPDGSFCSDNGANSLGLTCYNGGQESSQAHPYYLSIAAVNSNGKHTSYSTAGANLMVSAPSGEYGRWAPAMITTDPMTCLSGVSGFEGRSISAWSAAYGETFAASQWPFDYPGHEENPSCNYRSTMNGTSSAAPNASGIVSLILSANPELTWRDVRHILASTATEVDPDNAPISLTIADGEFVAHQGWFENAAGYTFNNLYGFGRVDAGAAVEMALDYNQNLGAQQVSSWIDNQDGMTSGEIPDNDPQGVTHTIMVEDDVTVEAMQFKFDITNRDMGFGVAVEGGYAQTTAGTDLAIEVTSPSGTRSVLLSSKQALMVPALDLSQGFAPGYILKDGVLMSNAFYGESSQGEWTIRVLDTSDQSFEASDGGNNVGQFVRYDNNAHPSVLQHASIRVFGHNSGE